MGCILLKFSYENVTLCLLRQSHNFIISLNGKGQMHVSCHNLQAIALRLALSWVFKFTIIIVCVFLQHRVYSTHTISVPEFQCKRQTFYEMYLPLLSHHRYLVQQSIR